MTDEEKVQQALAELWDVVKCRCNEAYTGRGLHDPDCQCDSADAVQTVANATEALTKERDQHWDSFVHWRKEADDRSEQLTAARQDAKEAEAYAEELEREQKTKALEQILDERGAVFDAMVDAAEDAAGKDVSFNVVVGRALRAALAEIKGESHD